MLRSLIKKADKIQKQVGNPKKKLKRNTRNQNTVAIMESATGLLVDTTWLRKKFNKLEDRSMNSKDRSN